MKKQWLVDILFCAQLIIFCIALFYPQALKGAVWSRKSTLIATMNKTIANYELNGTKIDFHLLKVPGSMEDIFNQLKGTAEKSNLWSKGIQIGNRMIFCQSTPVKNLDLENIEADCYFGRATGDQGSIQHIDFSKLPSPQMANNLEIDGMDLPLDEAKGFYHLKSLQGKEMQIASFEKGSQTKNYVDHWSEILTRNSWQKQISSDFIMFTKGKQLLLIRETDKRITMVKQ